MEERGVFAPQDAEDVREQWAAVGPAAQEVTRELARAMAFDRSEYRDRVDAEVIRTARDAIFASLLRVVVGARGEYESVLDRVEYEVIEHGSDHVERVVWHVSPATETIIAATFQSEPDAAIATLRRQAYGRLYREILSGSESA